MATPSQSAVTARDSFAIARELLLEGAGLELAALERALSAAMVRKLDYVDLYLQLTRYETWTVEDGIVKEGAYSVDQGIGVRAICGERRVSRTRISSTRPIDRRRRGARASRARKRGSHKLRSRASYPRCILKFRCAAERRRQGRRSPTRLPRPPPLTPRRAGPSTSPAFSRCARQATDGTLAALCGRSCASTCRLRKGRPREQG